MPLNKKMIYRLPIAVKLSLTIIMLMLLWFGASTYFGIYQLKTQINASFDTFVRQHIRNSESFLTKSILTDDRWGLFSFLSTLSHNDLIKEVGIVDEHNRIIAHTAPREHPIDSSYNLTGEDHIERIPLKIDNTLIATMVVEKNTIFMDRQVRDILVNNLLFFLLSALIAVAVAMFVSKRLLYRLTILTKSSHLAAQSRWEELSIPTFDEHDEITEALEAFSHMSIEIKTHIDTIHSTSRFYQEILEAIDMPIFICNAELAILYHNTHPLWEQYGEEMFGSFLGEIAKEFSLSHSMTIEKDFRLGETLISLLFHINLVEGRQYVVSILDITRLKELERHEQMAQSLAILGQISASLSHELKNFLSPLKLLIQSQQPWNEKDRSVVSNVVGKMDKLLINFLQFAKPPTFQDAPDAIDLAQIIEDIIHLLRPQFESKRVALQSSLHSIILPNISRKQIEIILMNLLLNALQASNEDSIVSIQTKSKEHGIEIIVEDQGSGIDPSIQERIFEPFFTTKKGGTGLGLATVYRIVYDTGGQVHLYSVEGLTRFTLYFPYPKEYL